MDEAKTLVNLSLSVLFAGLLLSVIFGCISLGYMLWGNIDRQENANKSIATYANYASFDNQYVRGQDVMAEILSDHDIYYAFFDCSTMSNTVIEQGDIQYLVIASDSLRTTWHNDNNGVILDMPLDGGSQISINTGTSLENQIKSKLSTCGRLRDTGPTWPSDTKHGKWSDIFLSTDWLGDPDVDGAYAKFYSTLITDNTGNVLGMCFIRLPSDWGTAEGGV